MKKPFALLLLLPLMAGCAASPRPAAKPMLPAAASATPSSQNEAALYLNVVEQLEAQDHSDAALAFLDAYALRKPEPEARYWLLRGRALLSAKRAPEARIAFEKLKTTTLSADGWNGCGQADAAAGQWSAAETNFLQAAQLRPTDAQFLNNLAFAQMRLGKAAAAATRLRQAHQLNPASTLIRNNLVIALTVANDKAGAAAVLAEIKDSNEREELRQGLPQAIAGLSGRSV